MSRMPPDAGRTLLLLTTTPLILARHQKARLPLSQPQPPVLAVSSGKLSDIMADSDLCTPAPSGRQGASAEHHQYASLTSLLRIYRRRSGAGPGQGVLLSLGGLDG
jgi:hypothetical protein